MSRLRPRIHFKGPGVGRGRKVVGVLLHCSRVSCSLPRAGAGGNQPDQMRGVCPCHPETLSPTLPVLPLLPGHPWGGPLSSAQAGTSLGPRPASPQLPWGAPAVLAVWWPPRPLAGWPALGLPVLA